MILDKTSIKIPCPELRGALAGVTYPAFAEVKVDGEFCFIHISQKQSFTVNKYGKIRMDFPYLSQLSSEVLSRNSSATFLGELYCNDGKNGQLYELLKMKESNDLKLFAFDIIELNKVDLRNQPLIDRKEILREVITAKYSPLIKMVNDELEATERFKAVTSKGFEGIVIKPLESTLVLGPCTWVKLKGKDRTDYRILRIDPAQERMEISVLSTKGSISVGVKCAEKYKKWILKDVANGMDTVTIEHQGVLASGSLRHPVLVPRKEWK